MSYFIPGNPEPNRLQQYIRSHLPETDIRSKVPVVGLDFLRIEEITDPWQAFTLGEDARQNGWYWSGPLAVGHDTSWYTFEGDRKRSMPSNNRVVVYDQRANGGMASNPNIGIVWHSWDYNNGKTINHLYVSVYGCDHDWEGKSGGRCFVTYTCTKCGYSYGVDSSD